MLLLAWFALFTSVQGAREELPNKDYSRAWKFTFSQLDTLLHAYRRTR